MDYMPFFFNLRNRPCLFVGGGSIATRKARLLAKAGARLLVVAPEVEQELRELVAFSKGEIFQREFQTADIDSAELVVAASNQAQLNQQVSALAQAKKIPVNVVDAPHLCSIITPAIVDRSPLMVAITSGGNAPVLARQMRAKLEILFPSSYGALAALASRFRHQVKARIPVANKRLHFWDRIFNGPVAEMAFAGQIARAEQTLEKLLAADEPDNAIGEVYLVGGGPGDPDLLTFKALRLMQQADVVLYDRLVSDAVLNLVRRDAERIYVGKQRADHALPQQQINKLLVELAQQGQRVLRLKGGDPFIFGRGGEEIELLADANIPFQVVPGITAASGCAAYAGIPLTHRDYAQSVRFITGHTQSGDLAIAWDSLLDTQQTLVFYMGLTNIEAICRGLIDRGRDSETPAALVEKGTTASQRVLTGTLSNLAERIRKHNVHAPTLLIIGGVVSLHQQLCWFVSEADAHA